MRYEVTQSQTAFYDKNKSILFEDFFPLSVTDVIETFSSGYDLWRKHPEIKKMAYNQDLGTILFQLTHYRPIRLLFDRIVENEMINLNETSFQGAIAGVIVSGSSITIFSAEIPFTVTEKALLLAYGELKSVFAFRENDLYAAKLKKQGYAYGDALNSDDYPLIYR